LVLIQIPIIFALYYVFYKGIHFQGGVLYSFVHIPAHMNMMFLGILDIGKKSLVLAILAGISQYLQARFMPKPPVSPGDASFQASFNKSMNTQMKYVFPFIVAFIAYSISGAIALYWITSNLFMVGQQIYVKKKEFKIEVYGSR
jgi:YidC/Oxa1 family membrane protein insertase